MTETPTYRFWGHQKPIAFKPVAEATETAGKTAIMRLYGPIDSWGAPFGVSADEFSAALDQLGDVDSIDLHMHSPGGEVFEGVAIRNMLAQHPAKVNITVDGIAASIASVICTGADSVAMAPGSQMMIHDASGICLGNATDMETMRAALESLSSNIADLYAAKAGGNPADWRSAMQPETWYKAQEAVEAGLADRVLTADEAPTQPKASFDLSVFAHAGRDHAPAPFIPANHCQCGSNGTDVSGNPRMEHKDECPTRNQTPAAVPVAPSTDPKEADPMSDTLLDGLRKQLGLSDDADEATVLAANAEALTEKADTPPAPVASAEPAPIPEGKVIISENVLAELRAMAEAGAEARGKQLAEERDEAIQAAFSAGKISAARRDAWKASWDKDPEGTKADLDTLPARFPVAAMPGTPGHDGDTVKEAPFTEDEADALGALAGLPKGALR